MDSIGAAEARLSQGLIDRLSALINKRTVHIDRYNAQASSEVQGLVRFCMEFPLVAILFLIAEPSQDRWNKN